MDEPPKHADVAVIFTTLLTHSGLNAAGLAKKLDITPQAVSNYMVGRNEPGRKMIAAIIRAFPTINAAWLATGEGEPFPNGRYNEKPAPVTSTDTKPPADTEPEPPRPAGLHIVQLTYDELLAENADLHRRLAVSNNKVVDMLTDEVKRLRKKPMTSAEAADLRQTVEAIAHELPAYVAPGFKLGVHRQLSA